MKDNTFAGEAPRVRVSPIRQHLYVKMSSNGSIRHERYWIEADAGVDNREPFRKRKEKLTDLDCRKAQSLRGGNLSDRGGSGPWCIHTFTGIRMS